MRINHNISSLRALNQMRKSNYSLDKSLERLSSGKRINHAADDAAGLAISQKMDTQVRGLGQANRNAMDGISLIQTAEGALNEVHAMLQRIRELAVQVSNETYDASDRESVQAEVNELLSEVQRISSDTEFNERKLLNGNLDNRVFSSDDKIAEYISMSDGVEPGDYKFKVTTAPKQAQAEATANGLFDAAGVNGKVTAANAGTISMNGEEIDIEEGDSTEDVVNKLRTLSNRANVEMTVELPYANGQKITFKNKEYGNKPLEIKGATALLTGLGIPATSTPGVDIVIDTTNLSSTGFPDDVTAKTDGKFITFTGRNGFEFKVEGKPAEGGSTGTGTVTFNVLETGPLTLQIGANEGQFMSLKVPAVSPRTLRLGEVSEDDPRKINSLLNITNVGGAQRAITIVDDAVNAVSIVRSRLGAYQNRLEYTTANLSTASENLTASMSRIEDADMAYEMSQFTQKNIISQAGNSMLAQANQRPQALLQLLQRG